MDNDEGGGPSSYTTWLRPCYLRRHPIKNEQNLTLNLMLSFSHSGLMACKIFKAPPSMSFSSTVTLTCGTQLSRSSMPARSVRHTGDHAAEWSRSFVLVADRAMYVDILFELEWTKGEGGCDKVCACAGYLGCSWGVIVLFHKLAREIFVEIVFLDFFYFSLRSGHLYDFFGYIFYNYMTLFCEGGMTE